jgi:hypothetical protein
MAELTDDGQSCILSNMDGEQELQYPVQTKQHIAEGAKYVNFTVSQQIRWQREVLAIVERVSTCAEAIEGARGVLNSLLEAQACEQARDRIHASLDCKLDSPSTIPLGQPVDQRNDLEAQARGQDRDRVHVRLDCNLDSPSTAPLRQSVDHGNDLEAQWREQDRDRVHVRLDCNLDSPSTAPLRQPVDRRNEAIGISGIARPCADRPPVQLEAKPEYFLRLVRAAAAWFSELVSRSGSRSRN